MVHLQSPSTVAAWWQEREDIHAGGHGRAIRKWHCGWDHANARTLPEDHRQAERNNRREKQGTGFLGFVDGQPGEEGPCHPPKVALTAFGIAKRP